MPDPSKLWKSVINNAADLVTTAQATQAGFSGQAIAKVTAATPYVEQAKALATALADVSAVEKILELTEHRDQIAAACGLSAKARGHVKTEEVEIVRQALAKIFEETKSLLPADAPAETVAAAFRQQIVYRYLLTAGDTLGGSMRNQVGALGARTLTAAILAALSTAGHTDVEVGTSPSGKVRMIAWDSRLIVFDRKPTLKCGGSDVVCNNIDVCVLDTSQVKRLMPTALSNKEIDSLLQSPCNYLAAGELKSGIDPAGADEHWKTTLAALDRVKTDFERCDGHSPQLFFVGGAIELAMAAELFKRLTEGTYAFAANLTQPVQLQALASWIINL